MLDEVKRMKEAIKTAQLSYMQLEKLTGVSHSTLQRYLTGKTNRIPLSAVEKIANATGVSAQWIMGWELPDNAEQSDDELDREIIEGYSRLSEENKKIVSDLIEVLLSRHE